MLLTRPEGPIAHIRIILDHSPGYEVLLPIPAHRDVIYLQQGDGFLEFPGGGPMLPRFISLSPSETSGSKISLSVQQMTVLTAAVFVLASRSNNLLNLLPSSPESSTNFSSLKITISML